MQNIRPILGLDTSCYTTSAAVACDGGIIASKRRLLPVPEGARGLRQSEMVFHHNAALPGLIEAAVGDARDSGPIAAVCASAWPRDVQGSYMPAFTVGEGYARAIAAAWGVPFYATSHQQGHMAAARVESGLPEGEHLALHLSGGTTELLRCIDNPSGVPCVSLMGGTLDLAMGQLVDRIGVLLGLPFPAGPHLEALAEGGVDKARILPSMDGTNLHVSGAEAALKRLSEGGAPPEDVAAAVYGFLARSAARMITEGMRTTGLYSVLLAGGVASSTRFRRLVEELVPPGASLYWAKPELAGDNAAGVALIGASLHAHEMRAKES